MEGINGAALRKRIARRISRYGEQALLEQRMQQVGMRDHGWKQGDKHTKLEGEI